MTINGTIQQIIADIDVRLAVARAREHEVEAHALAGRRIARAMRRLDRLANPGEEE